MMETKRLSENEISVLQKIAHNQVNSFIRLADKGHPILDECLEAHLGYYEITGYDSSGNPILGAKISMLNILEEAVVLSLEFEKILEDPYYTFQLRKNELGMVLLQAHIYLPEEKYPKLRRSLLGKLKFHYQLKTLSLN